MGVSGSSQDFEDSVLNGKKRDVEGSTTEIVDDDLGLGLAGAVETVCCVMSAKTQV